MAVVWLSQIFYLLLDRFELPESPLFTIALASSSLSHSAAIDLAIL